MRGALRVRPEILATSAYHESDISCLNRPQFPEKFARRALPAVSFYVAQGCVMPLGRVGCAGIGNQGYQVTEIARVANG